MLTEINKILRKALPMAHFREHLKLSSGFDDDMLQEPVLEAHLRGAISLIEGRVAKITLKRDFIVHITQWRGRDSYPLPLAPVSALLEVKSVSGAGMSIVHKLNEFALLPDYDRPCVVPIGGVFPPVPAAGQVQITFSAGMADVWSDLPSDMAEAIMITAAQAYEERTGQKKIPAAALALLEKYRAMRLGKRVL